MLLREPIPQSNNGSRGVVSRATIAVFAMVALLFGPGSLRGQEPGELRVGVFAADITPDFPVSVNGNMGDITAQRAHDRLHARCFVFDNGKTKLAFAICDSCMIPRPIHDKAKALAEAQTGISRSAILISATHTHSAPTATGVFQSDPDPRYVAKLPGLIAGGIAEAAKRLAPAEIGWTTIDHAQDVFHRRWRKKPGTIGPNPFGEIGDKVQMNPPVASPDLLEPAGPIDPQIVILAARTLDHKPLGLLAIYSLHYVGGVPGDGVSADYFGAFADIVPNKLPGDKAPGFLAAMANGTSGNINNVNFRQVPPARKSFEQLRLVADRVASKAASAHADIVWRKDAQLGFGVEELSLDVRKPSPEQLTRAKALLAQAKPGSLRTMPEIYARESVKLNDYPNEVQVLVQALRVGDLGFVAIPCEVFVEIGLELKAISPFKPTAVISLANGYFGYLPTAAGHDDGGYETWRARSSFLARDAAEKIVAASHRLLRKLR